MRKYLYGLISGVVAVFVVGSIVGFSGLKLGLVPVNADSSPPAWEKRLASIAVRASVARQVEQQAKPVPPTEEDLIMGASIYKEECARCHGQGNGRQSTLGSAFYPPVPQLPGRSSEYSEPELFWIVKHGVRNTSMPAWGRQLSDNDIWQVVALIKRFDSLPPAVQAQLNKRD